MLPVIVAQLGAQVRLFCNMIFVLNHLSVKYLILPQLTREFSSFLFTLHCMDTDNNKNQYLLSVYYVPGTFLSTFLLGTISFNFQHIL